MKKKHQKLFAFIAILILVVSTLPIISLGFFNHALGDDYYYGVYAKQALRNGPWWDVIKEACKGVVREYHIWQGTYSAMFLMYLPPHVFGDFFYKLYPSVLVCTFIFGIFFLSKNILCKFLHTSRHEWILISSILAFLCLQQVPVMGEAFYWYNGSMYYTGFYALTLFFFGEIIRFLNKGSKMDFAFNVLLGLIIAGGNYTSLLPTLIIMTLILAFLILNKKPAKLTCGFATIYLITIIGFLISTLAPGNAVRQSFSYGTTPIKAILKAIVQAFLFLRGWSNLYIFICVSLLTPLFVKIILENNVVIKYPLLDIILSFGVFASMTCPSFYAQNTGGPARSFDLSWYSMVLFVFVAHFCFLYFVIKHNLFFDFTENSFLKLNTLFIGVIVIVFVVLALLRPIKETYIQLNGVQCVNAIISGDAKYYDSQYKDRMKQIEESGGSLFFQKYDVPQSLVNIIYLGDLSADPEFQNNVAYAAFYNVDSVQIIE